MKISYMSKVCCWQRIPNGSNGTNRLHDVGVEVPYRPSDSRSVARERVVDAPKESEPSGFVRSAYQFCATTEDVHGRVC